MVVVSVSAPSHTSIHVYVVPPGKFAPLHQWKLVRSVAASKTTWTAECLLCRMLVTLAEAASTASLKQKLVADGSAERSFEYLVSTESNCETAVQVKRNAQLNRGMTRRLRFRK